MPTSAKNNPAAQPTSIPVLKDPSEVKVFNVVLIGETGAGKSSIINVLLNKDCAPVSSNVVGTTKAPCCYRAHINSQQYQVWDTMGFNHAQSDDPGDHSLVPYEQAYALLRSLPDGVDLLLICVRHDRVTATLGKICWLFNDFFFGGQARIVLVRTHGAGNMSTKDWWTRNQDHFLKHIRCAGQVYIDATKPTPDSRAELSALLDDCAGSNPTQLSANIDFVTAPSLLAEKCSLAVNEASWLVQKFTSNVARPRVPNIVLFGEAGVGKSSIINLLAEKSVAPFASKTKGCTLESQGYIISIRQHKFRIYDTVGLNESELELTGYARAVQHAAQLIRSLHRDGGVDLLLFCMRGSRITATTIGNYKLFHEHLCGSKVPIALVVTHLENTDRMEDCSKFESLVGHACVTAIDDHRHIHEAALAQSRLSLHALLETWASGQGRQYTLDVNHWIMTFLKSMFVFVKQQVRRPTRLEKKEVRSLLERCGLTRRDVQELACLAAV
ncbi:hypothetical protein HYDPIDRAFT_108364 [Hydnomerulius pinastri MD-312]|nr:hypothetical protein HYDPIDRAFT_108364 [Hydnomerulius pinastri MD-312]